MLAGANLVAVYQIGFADAEVAALLDDLPATLLQLEGPFDGQSAFQLGLLFQKLVEPILVVALEEDSLSRIREAFLDWQEDVGVEIVEVLLPATTLAQARTALGMARDVLTIHIVAEENYSRDRVLFEKL
jgi:hypothetical protein